MGAEQLHPVEEGDELCGQEQTFQEWASDIFKVLVIHCLLCLLLLLCTDCSVTVYGS